MSRHVLIKSRAMERWCQVAGINERTAEEVLAHAQAQVEEAILDRVHPMLAAQTYLACLIACFEGCDLPKKQRREWLSDFFQLIEPVVAEQAPSWVPADDGPSMIVN